MDRFDRTYLRIDADALARRVLADYQSAGDLTPTMGMQRACDQVRTVLGGVLGEAMVSAMLERAAQVTTTSPAYLRDVGIEPGKGGDLSDIAENSAETAENFAIQEVYPAVLTSFIRMLVTFIGEPLTMKFLHETWPHVNLLPEGGHE